MLHKPILASCDNRNVRARKHPSSGDPEEWLADTYLKHYGLLGLTFDFFVNWRNNGSIPNQLWIKRIVHDAFTPWPIEHAGGVPNAIYQCDGEEKVRQLCRFADSHKFTCHYFLFKESGYWGVRPEPIVEVRFDSDGTVVRILRVKLPDLEDRIRQLREGRASVGPKGVAFALTSLECYLSKTDKLWPGDADLVLVDANLTPVAIIEFKKHTHRSKIPFADQKFSNYYPRPDGRKYDSFAYFRDHFTDDPSTLPIVILYYSIETEYDYVMLELVEGAAKTLTAPTAPVRFPLPNINNAQSCRNLVDSLMKMINYGI